MPSRPRTLAVAVAGVVTLTGCLDDGVPDLESGPVLTTLDDVGGIDPVARLLDACPVAEFEELVEESVELVDDDVVLDALDGADRSDVVVVDGPDGSVPVIRCELVAPGATVGLRFAPSPGARDAHDEFALDLDAVTARSQPDEVTNVLSDVYRGGEFIRICVDHDADADDECSLDWVDRGGLDEEERETDDEPRALVGLTIRGDGALDVDLRLLEERWRLMLPLVIQRLE